MAKLKSSELQKMSKEDREKKIEELKLELVKSRISTKKSGNSKTKQIKRLIAKIKTINK